MTLKRSEKATTLSGNGVRTLFERKIEEKRFLQRVGMNAPLCCLRNAQAELLREIQKEVPPAFDDDQEFKAWLLLQIAKSRGIEDLTSAPTLKTCFRLRALVLEELLAEL